jgi:hypothetical protein
MASYGALAALLEATPEIASVPGLPDKVAVLSAKVGEINSLAKTQTKPLLASMTERDLVLDEMADQAVEIAGLITTLARDIKAPQLAEAVEVGRSSFRRVRRGHRQWFAQRVLDTAVSVLPQLAAYGVTAETLDTFRARIAAAHDGVHATRNVAVDKIAATRRLTDLFQEVDELIDDQIDRMVFRLRKNHPEFDAHYEEARSIVNRRGRRVASAGTSASPATVPVPRGAALAPFAARTAGEVSPGPVGPGREPAAA